MILAHQRYFGLLIQYLLGESVLAALVPAPDGNALLVRALNSLTL